MINVDKVTILNGCNPFLVDFNNFTMIFLDGEIVFQNRTVDLPIFIVPDLDHLDFPELVSALATVEKVTEHDIS